MQVLRQTKQGILHLTSRGYLGLHKVETKDDSKGNTKYIPPVSPESNVSSVVRRSRGLRVVQKLTQVKPISPRKSRVSSSAGYGSRKRMPSSEEIWICGEEPKENGED